MSRTYRRSYTGSKRFDASCRSHGGCPYCEDGRKHNDRRHIPADEERQIENGYLGYDPEEMEEIEAILADYELDLFEEDDR